MDGYDGVYQAVEAAGRGDGVLFDELGEVVQARGEREREEDEAEEKAEVAEKREDVHFDVVGGGAGGIVGGEMVVLVGFRVRYTGW